MAGRDDRAIGAAGHDNLRPSGNNGFTKGIEHEDVAARWRVGTTRGASQWA